jgi:hypothetical protein
MSEKWGRTPFFSLAGMVLIAVGCTSQPTSQIACTMEAKACPDGSSVGRNPEKNCEFNPCPE